nr:MAG TPA: hypothetical protein [Caudoviricetes sp.]
MAAFWHKKKSPHYEGLFLRSYAPKRIARSSCCFRVVL